MEKLFFAMLTAAMSVSAHAFAASISTAYDMNRMLNEPHPMANEYGTRWAPPPTSGYSAPPQGSSAPAPRLIAPMPYSSAAPAPTAASPALAPHPPLPPSMPAPAQAPTPISADPAPLPAAAPKPVVTAAPVDVRVLKLSPRLSIDTGGLDVDVVKTAPPPPPPVLPDPGK